MQNECGFQYYFYHIIFDIYFKCMFEKQMYSAFK